MSGGLRVRLLATAAVLGLAGTAAALGLADEGEPDSPAIELDAQGPLFTLQGMRPGDPPVERCTALRAIGGNATRVELTGSVTGPLADALALDVATGSGPAPGSDRGCDGFAAQRTLWSGMLAEFPGDSTPAVAEPLAAGTSRIFRFRVWLPADAVVAESDRAELDLRWRADLEVPQQPTTPAAPPTGPGSPPATPPPPDGRAPERDPFGLERCGVGGSGGGGSGSGSGSGSVRGSTRLSRACRGRLIVRMTRHGARLHGRIHAPASDRIRTLSLRLPASLPAGRAWIDLARTRATRPALTLSGSVRLQPRPGRGLLAIRGLPRGTRTVLMRVRVPPPARAPLVHAACRRTRVTALMTTDTGRRRQLTARLYIARASCRR